MATEPVSTKRCTKCGETKPVTAFGKQECRKDGLNPWCKSCKKAASAEYNSRPEVKARRPERDRAWSRANPEKRRAINRRWRANNPEKAAAACADWARRNPERRREYARNDYWRHHEKRKAASRAGWAANAARYRETARQWRERNKEVRRQHSRNYKAKKRSASGSHTAADIRRIFALQRGRCAYCPRSLRKGFHVDHVVPLSKGGTNNPNNLQLTCAFCNISKKDKDPLVFARSLGRLL